MRVISKRLSRFFAPSLLVASAMTALLGAASLAAGSPGSVRIGDIIAFEPDPTAGMNRDVRIVVHRPGQYGCVLDIGTMQQGGGSLVVEARLASEGHRFRLHWAGAHTTIDSGDCGSSADLIIDRRDLAALAAAAGSHGWQGGGIRIVRLH